MTRLRCAGACWLAAAVLVLPLAVRANGAKIVLDRVKSHVEVAVKSTLVSFVARVEVFEAVIAIDPENSRIASTTFHADLAAVKTGRADRDHNMGVWLQMSEFPQVVFELTGMDRGPNGALIARGRFQFHGQQHDLRFPVTVTVSRGLTTIDGTATLDTRDFDLPIIRYWLLTVDPVVQVHFHLEGN